MASEENNKADLILFILDKLIKVSQFIIQAVPHLIRWKIGISIILRPGSTFSLSRFHWLLPCRPCLRHQWGMGFPQTRQFSFSSSSLSERCHVSMTSHIPQRAHRVCAIEESFTLVLTSCTVNGIGCHLLYRVNCHSFDSWFSCLYLLFLSTAFFNKRHFTYPTNK